MIKEFLVSFSDNFREKTRNPFLGTYILIWLLRNWELVYSLFNFDNTYKLADKIEFIKMYYTTHSFTEGVLWNLGWTFLVLTITYLVLNMSRVIVNISEKQLKPWIYKKTDSKSIVLKSIHEQVRNERDTLQIRLDQERESKSKLEIRIKSLEEEVTTASTKKTNDNELDDIETSNKSSDEKEKLLNKLIELNMLSNFKEIGVMINKGEFIEKNNTSVNKLIELGLIIHKKENFAGISDLYSLTEDGKQLFKLVRLR